MTISLRSFISFVVVAAVVATVAAPLEAAEEATSRVLGFEERVAAFEAVEDVYWTHRIWPESNSRPKPRRDEVVPHARIVAKVERSLLLEGLLLEVWGERVGERRIQAELDRVFAGTHHPMLLGDVVDALGHDPVLVAECYVRPRLVERLVRERFARDGAIHAELRGLVEAALEGTRHLTDLDDAGERVSEATWILIDAPGSGRPPSADLVELDPDEWAVQTAQLAERFHTTPLRESDAPVPPGPGGLLARQAGQGASPFFETPTHFAAVEILAAEQGRLRVASAVWPKVSFDHWLRTVAREVPPFTPTVGSYVLPKSVTGDPCLDDTWTPTAGSGPPSPRSNLSAVWTGTEMIVFGGKAGNGLETGGRYDPVADTWLPTSTSDAPSPRWAHAAVWTGTDMVVWGGYNGASALASGGRYDPDTDTWMPVSVTGAPAPRWGQLCVWTGTTMVVWGGYDGSGYFNTGGVYDPLTDSWTATTTVGAPSARYLCAVVWTGSEMIVWGGYAGSVSLGDGGRYDPVADSWTALSTTGAPAARYYNHGVWTGSEMITWGGHSGTFPLADGGRYDPATDSWTATSNVATPSYRYTHTLVWTGSEMIVWGGFSGSVPLATGGRYDPVSDSWTPTSPVGAPGSRRAHTAIWTGSEMIVWGGGNSNSSVTYDTGGRYDPTSDSWLPTATTGAVTAAHNYTAVWTGAEMIVWGGYNSTLAAYLDSGGRYDPATDSWTATATTGAPSERASHAAVWSGNEMIVWGGYGGTNLSTGGRYNPGTDSWTATSDVGAPPGRYNLTGIWSGSEMIVWGGWTGAGVYSSGGRYDPVADSWVATPTSGAPAARQLHAAVWTGSEMIIWGGWTGTATNTGGRYDPAADSWAATSTSDAPTPRYYLPAVWTGSEMLVWGGYDGGSSLGVGGRYDPAADSWLPMAAAGEPSPRQVHALVWTGSEMIAWGGNDGTDYPETGGRYDPVADSWTATSRSFTPPGRNYLGAVWTGARAEMIVWGGHDGAFDLDSGGRYCASGVLGIDWGDAPDPGYPTLAASDGARHPFDGVLYLGSSVDGEADGRPSASADGDDLDGTDDEDGVVLVAPLRVGFTSAIRITASAAGLLNAWLDLNADGDWDDPGEQIFTDQPVTAGTADYPVAIPADAAWGVTYGRFRLDSAGGLATTGLAADGEVEDHQLTIEPTAELAVSIDDLPDPVDQGGRLRYEVVVENHGGLEATSVVLAQTLDPFTEFVSASLPVCSHAAGVVTCDLGTVAAGSSAAVSIEADVDAMVAGSLTTTGVVTLAEDDPIAANNAASEVTGVTTPPGFLFGDDFELGDTRRWSAVAP